MNSEVGSKHEEMAKPKYRPALKFYHPNPKGTGCALELQLHPAHDDTSGSIWARFANQLTVRPSGEEMPGYARFDWENSVCVKLDFTDLSKMLQVFRGECEAIGNGRGLYHVSPRGKTRIVLRHQLEPNHGYSLEVYRTMSDGGEARSHILLNGDEALGFGSVIEGSLAVIAFGIPVVLPHDTAVYKAQTREMRNGERAA